jgi:V-type H+-transporting ATPase subunit a
MKTSVILGVLQMSLGICMKGFNALYFGAYVDFFFEFIPQISLLLALFGWMDTLIIGKWLTHVNVEYLEDPGVHPFPLDKDRTSPAWTAFNTA